MTLRKIVIAVWLLFLIACIGTIVARPSLFTPQKIAEFLSEFKNTLLIVYLAVSLLRGFTLVPSTPVVLAGTILFPSEPFLVLLISIVGILFSSSMLYFFSDYLGFGQYLERKHPAKIAKIHGQLQKPAGALFVMLWAFTPFVPTDAVCYVAGVLRMNFARFIIAVAIGELILCSIYIFSYSQIPAIL